jgi:hypothetical protein
VNCKEFHKQVASGENPGFLRRIDYFFHSLMCDLCRAYVRQIKAIGRGYRQMMKKRSSEQEIRVRELEERILTDLKSRDR